HPAGTERALDRVATRESREETGSVDHLGEAVMKMRRSSEGRQKSRVCVPNDLAGILPDMVLAACVLLLCSDPTTYSGRDHQLDVRIPRLDAEVVLDGDLGDSAWASAALVNGFSQYSPNDGAPAADSTQVLVWYSSTAIYFGIRAFELHGRPTMTLAN